MSTDQHTPGPWYASFDGRSVYVKDQLGYRKDDICWLPYPVFDGNARLIAAAPSLLKALEDLLDSGLVRRGWLPLPGKPGFPEMGLSLRERAAPIFAARAAIAAARLHNPQTQESGE
jgi:hypothetical protein